MLNQRIHLLNCLRLIFNFLFTFSARSGTCMYDNQNNISRWTAFCEGDQAAFLHLYEEHYNLLYVWAHRWVQQDPAWIQDQLQDFFVYLWEHRQNLSRDVKPRSYLLTAFKRHLFHYAAKERLQPRPIEDLDLPDFDTALADAEFFTEQFGKVEQAMQSLSPAQKEVVELRYLKNLSLQEIADQKKASLRTVYNLMHRALVHLKSELLKKKFLFMW